MEDQTEQSSETDESQETETHPVSEEDKKETE